MQECEDIKRQLPISSYLRPAWDVEELGKTGMEQISIDLGLSRRFIKRRMNFIIQLRCLPLQQRKHKSGAYASMICEY